MLCYNAVIADARMPSATDLQAGCSILSPELALPSGSHATTTRSHGALHILGNPLHQSLVSYEGVHEHYYTNNDGRCKHLCFFKADVTSVQTSLIWWCCCVVNVAPIFFLISWACHFISSSSSFWALFERFFSLAFHFKTCVVNYKCLEYKNHFYILSWELQI